MEWTKFYKKWATDVGSFIGQDVVQSWQAFVADAEEAVMLKAIEEIAAWYNSKTQRSDGYVANITLYQLRETYNRLHREANPEQLGTCKTCEGEGNVFVIDNGKYSDPDFPPEPGTDTWNHALCAVPCPVCQGERYLTRNLRERVYRRCRPNSRREELFSRQEVTA